MLINTISTHNILVELMWKIRQKIIKYLEKINFSLKNKKIVQKT